MWQIFIVSVAAFTYYLVEIPMLSIYQANNKHRTFEAAMNREKAYKKKMRELEEAEEEWCQNNINTILDTYQYLNPNLYGRGTTITFFQCYF